LSLARFRIERFHRRQLKRSWSFTDRPGIVLSQRWLPLQRVAIYIPGGKAAYPSSVLMNAIPAQIAGVPEIVMVTPPSPDKKVMHPTLGAAHLIGIKEVYHIGGAQAIAALAYGTQTIKPVDKIVGPGNIYVTEAKRLLYGVIDIDMLAGPSEIVVIADRTADVEFIAADLLSQTEHDEDAVAMAILIGNVQLKKLQYALAARLRISPRRKIASAALRRHGLIIRVSSRADAASLTNRIAPEHLEIMTAAPERIADKILHVGSIFIGPCSPEPIGDYVAGPNHVLPTGGTARFFSPLSVESFLKASNVIRCTRSGLKHLARHAVAIAEAEGLVEHANAIAVRLRGKKKQ
jgi:histidinol dehydrogenase